MGLQSAKCREALQSNPPLQSTMPNAIKIPLRKMKQQRICVPQSRKQRSGIVSRQMHPLNRHDCPTSCPPTAPPISCQPVNGAYST
ncbi:hypothetical protein SUGI_0268940 [Cryptomeria japonica]|nr:hypothetical protein SUGI_0268940 [Cryptomeria japonica]